MNPPQVYMHIQKERHYFANKGPSSQGYGFSYGHVWIWDLDCKESWAPKNWCFWTVVLEKTLESPLDCKEIKPVSPEGTQSWMYTFEGLMLKLKLQYLGYLMWRANWLEKSWLFPNIRVWKDWCCWMDWRQEEKETTEDEMVGWHHQLNGHEFEQAPGDGEGQGSLACCRPWGHKELDMTEWLNNNNVLGGEREKWTKRGEKGLSQ